MDERGMSSSGLNPVVYRFSRVIWPRSRTSRGKRNRFGLQDLLQG